jgi:aminoglycoside phosphotransferase (APT) family kinase protein
VDDATGPGTGGGGTAPAGIDVPAVTRWLEAHVGLAGPFTFSRLAGGHSNLTYRVVGASGDAVTLRRPPLGHLLPTAHDMGREHRIISALHPTDVPVARPLGHCTDPEVTGAPFYVMEFVEGVVLHTADIARQDHDEAQRRRAGESFVDVLADLHDIDPDEVDLGGLGRHEGYVARQLARWYGQWQQSKTRELPTVDRVHDRLAATIPDAGPARVVHGDYRLGNCITSRSTGEVLAVLDWEIATLGDPLADLGYVLATWAEPTDVDPPPSAPTQVPGFPTRLEVQERYARRSGRDLADIDFYVSFAAWKSACINEGVYARYLAGALDATGVDLDGLRATVDRYAAVAAELADARP